MPQPNGVHMYISVFKCSRFPRIRPLTRSFHVVQGWPECSMAKAHRRSFTGNGQTPKYVGQVWQVDVKGPIQCESLVYGNKYVFGLIDLKSRFLVQYFIKTKDEVFRCFKLFYQEFIKYVRSLPQNKDMGVITIISDRGEFNSDAIAEFCLDKGLSPITTCAYTPEHNGMIERTWRSISEAAIAMLITANLSEPYWELARDCAGYIRNRIPGGHPSSDPLSPFEKFYGIPPHISHFKVFGVWAYAVIPNKEKNHAPKAEQGVFVGYSERKIGGYKVYLPKGNEIIESAHVRCGTSPTRTSGELEDIERIDVSFLGKDLLGRSKSTPPATAERSSPVPNPNVISKDGVCQVQGGTRRQGRAKGSHRPPAASAVPVLLHQNASPDDTACVMPHVGLDMTRKTDTHGNGTVVMAHERDGNGGTEGPYHNVVRIDNATLPDIERERTDHPQPDLSQRPVLSEGYVRIYSTPVKDVTATRSRLWEVEHLAPEERELSRVSQRQKELDESMPNRDLEEGNKRPRDDSEGCPHPVDKLTGTSTKKRRDVSELDQHLMDASESGPIHTDDSEVCPRPSTSSKKKQYASAMHKDVSESGQHLLGTSESDHTQVRNVAIMKAQDVSESDQHLVGASESDHTLAHNIGLRKYTDVSELDQHLKGTSEFDHTLARNDASGRKTSIKVSDISNVCLLPVPWLDGYGLATGYKIPFR